MPFDSAVDALRDRSDDSKWAFRIEHGDGGALCVIGDSSQVNKKLDLAELMFFDVSLLRANADGNVQSYMLRGRFAQDLFSAYDMDLEQFAQEFVDAYSVPELSPQVKRGRNLNGDFVSETTYVYQSPDGWKVTLSGATQILGGGWVPIVMMELVAAASERKFD